MIQKIKYQYKKKHYAKYAIIIEGMMSSKFTYELINKELNLPFDSLYEYQKFISHIYFPQMNPLENLKFYIGYQTFEESLKENILKDIMYPSFLLILSFILTLSFNKSFAPSIIEMLEGFNVSTSHLQIIFIITKLLNYMWYLFAIALMMLVVMLLSKDLPFVLYIRYHQSKPFKIIKNILTLRFCFVYQFFLDHNLSTQDFIKLTNDVVGLEDVKWLSNHIKRNLEKGKELKEAIDLSYFDPFFKLYFLKGYFNQNLNKSLKEYIFVLNKIIHQEIKQVIQNFKIFVYVYILLFIVIYYTFLFQPLSILEAIV